MAIAEVTGTLPTLPGRYYYDPAIHAVERERIFGRGWLCVGYAAQLAGAGDYLTVELAGESAIVVRGRDGAVRAFLNVCRHRGARLCSEPCGQLGGAIRCRYHAWTYALDGRLIGVPNMPGEGLDREAHGLVPVALAEWAGLLFLNFDEDADPAGFPAFARDALLERFGEVELFGRYRLDELRVARSIGYDVRANWKLVIENFMECYHCGPMHPELCDLLPGFRGGAAYQQGHGTEFAEGVEGFTVSGKATRPPLPGINEDDRRRYYGLVLKPTILMSLLPDHAVIHRLWPEGPDATRITCDWLFHPETMALPGFDPEDTVALFDLVNRQDWEVCELAQAGARSRAFRNGGVYVPLEHHIRRFNDWVVGMTNDE
jgi:Rieske 2Fe-2S family protein